MKKWIFFGLVFFACTSFRNIGVDLNEIRTLYKESVNSKKACEKLIEISVSDETNSSLISGYKGCATIIMAKYFSNPFTKMSHFKNGKNILEKAIGADENNIELRFLRFTVQTSTPAFLGYNHNLEMDKAAVNINVFRNRYKINL